MNKRLLSIALAVCVLALAAFGTLAYFTDSEQVVNKFSVSQDPNTPPDDPDDIFSIELFETDEDGEETTEGLEFNGIIPGSKVDKDPTVRNTGENTAWVRVIVTVTDAAAWQAACTAHGIASLESIFGGFDDAKWTRFDDPVFDSANDTLSYTYYLNDALAAGETATLFTTVTIPTALTVDEMFELAEFDLTISADAIQSANTADSAYAAFTDFWS